MARKTSSRYAIVTSFNPNNYSAQTLLQPENIATGPLPVATPGIGFYLPPTAGNQVTIEFVDGDLTSGFVLAAFYNSQTLPIQGDLQPQSGEFWYVNPTNGNLIRVTNDGKVYISDAHGASVEMDGAGNIISAANSWTHTGTFTIDGDTTITGNVSVSGTLESTGDGTVNGVDIKNHTHSGGTIAGDTGPPL